MHRHAVVVDTHNDISEAIVWSGYDFAQRHAETHSDLPRMKEGGLDAQIFSIWINPKRVPREKWWAETEHELVALREKLSKVPGVALATTAAEVRANKQRGLLSALFGVEGGHSLQPGSPDEQLARLRRLAELGTRYLTLTWSISDDLGGSSGDEGRTQGLIDFGRRAIAEMERLGIVVDVSHLSEPLFWDAIRAAKKPVLASHSSARQLANVPRNLTDAQLEAVKKNGGAVCVNFFSGFLDERYFHELRRIGEPMRDRLDPMLIVEQHRLVAPLLAALPPVPLAKLIDHIDHIAKVAGIDHTCLGSDFDGIPAAPAGIDDVSKLPAITAELLRRGYKEADVAKILGGNVLRVLEANEPAHASRENLRFDSGKSTPSAAQVRRP